MIKLKSLFRRGSPSSTSSASTKQTNLISPAHSVGIKTSQSASSLDRIGVLTSGSASADLGATRKLKNNKQSSKDSKQSSKDKLNDLLKSSSKEKLFDDKKEIKRFHKQKQMQQVVHQAHNSSSVERHSPNEHRAERAKDSDSSAVNGIQDVSFFNSNLSFRTTRPRATPNDPKNGNLCKLQSRFQLTFSCLIEALNRSIPLGPSILYLVVYHPKRGCALPLPEFISHNLFFR